MLIPPNEIKGHHHKLWPIEAKKVERLSHPKMGSREQP